MWTFLLAMWLAAAQTPAPAHDLDVRFARMDGAAASLGGSARLLMETARRSLDAGRVTAVPPLNAAVRDLHLKTVSLRLAADHLAEGMAAAP